MEIRVSSKFRKSYKRLPLFVKNAAEEREVIFQNNPFDPRLETHKLHGKYKDYWAFTVIGQYRIMCEFIDSTTVGFINIGTHEIYK